MRRRIGDQQWVMRASVDPKKFTAFVRSSYLAGDAEAFVVNPAGERQTVTITGPGRITVRTRLDGRWICIDVADTGCGMTPEVLRNIFFPFFTTEAVGKGTGLGMSISYGLIQAAGGEIEVDSEVGRGTTMTVRLPADSKIDRKPLKKSGDQHGRAAATAQ